MTTLEVKEAASPKSNGDGRALDMPSDRAPIYRGGYTVVGSGFEQWPEVPEAGIEEYPPEHASVDFYFGNVHHIMEYARSHTREEIIEEMRVLVKRLRDAEN